MNKYIVLQGCPASGKSTWANEYMSRPEHSCTGRLNRDGVRRFLFSFDQWNEYRFSKEKENAVTKYLDDQFDYLVSISYDIIDDNTNLNPKYLKKTVDKAVAAGYEVEYVQFFDITLHKLIERDIYRQYSVGEDVIHRMFRAQLELQGRIIEPVDGLRECVIIDVDGTIADMGKGESWGRIPFECNKVSNDRPKKNVCNFVKSLISNYLCNDKAPLPIFVSGRDSVCYNDTKKWIYDHLFPAYVSLESIPLYMRAMNDMRPDCEIKEELLRIHILPRYNIAYAIDDRKQICDHYRALGLEVWQVDSGRF